MKNQRRPGEDLWEELGRNMEELRNAQSRLPERNWEELKTNSERLTEIVQVSIRGTIQE